jgi:hypothetical protein
VLLGWEAEGQGRALLPHRCSLGSQQELSTWTHSEIFIWFEMTSNEKVKDSVALE